MDRVYRIVIADDHEVVRCGVRFELEKYGSYEIVDEASSFIDLLSLLEQNQYDALVLDLNMGDQNGIQTIHKISDRYPMLKILVLSMFPEDPYAIKSIQAGAVGYLNKKILMGELKNAMETILQGNVYLDQEYEELLEYGTKLDKSI